MQAEKIVTLGKDSGEKSKEGSRKESEYRRDKKQKLGKRCY